MLALDAGQTDASNADATGGEPIFKDGIGIGRVTSKSILEKAKIKTDALLCKQNNSRRDYYRKKKLPIIDELSNEIPEDIEHKSMLDFCNCLVPFVEQLPSKYKDAILKTELGNLSQKEYAKELGISYSTLKSRVQRGKIELKKSFISCCNLQLDNNGKVIDSEENCSC